MASRSRQKPDNVAAGDWVHVARISGAHGVRGELRLQPLLEDADTLFRMKTVAIGPDGDPVTLTRIGRTKGGLRVKIKGVDDRNKAECLAGSDLFAQRSEFDRLVETQEDEYLVIDLAGLAVKNLSGDKVGYVRMLESFGAGDLLDIQFDKPVKGFGRNMLLPFTRALVPEVHISEGYLVVDMDQWLARQTTVESEEKKASGA